MSRGNVLLMHPQGTIERGRFLEAGAADGELMSNTLLLEMQGWTGALVEPWPHYLHEGAKKNRSGGGGGGGPGGGVCSYRLVACTKLQGCQVGSFRGIK